MSDLSEWKAVFPSQDELIRVGAVIVHGARIEQLLAFVLAELKSGVVESETPLQDAYAMIGGKFSLISDIRTWLESAGGDDRLAHLLDRSETVLEQRHGFAHGIPHVHVSGERAMIRTISATKARKQGHDSREVGVSLSLESVTLLCSDMLRVFRDLEAYLGPRLPDHVTESADKALDSPHNLS